MTRLKNIFKKRLLTSFISAAAVFLIVQPAYALSYTELFLYQIRNTTYAILDNLNKTPAYLEEITQMAQSWNSTDDPSDAMANTQNTLAMINFYTAMGQQSQVGTSLELMNNYLLLGSSDPESPSLPKNPNDVNYNILAGQPLPNTDAPDDLGAATKNYLSALAGMGFKLTQPNPNWRPSAAATNYESFYRTVASIKSFNAYILASLITQQQTNGLYDQLAQQAGDSNWFQQIATEPLGVVLRQILMYNSQTLIQLNRLVKIEQQILTEQAATSALISITAQQLTGEQLWQRAQSSRGGAAPPRAKEDKEEQPSPPEQ